MPICVLRKSPKRRSPSPKRMRSPSDDLPANVVLGDLHDDLHADPQGDLLEDPQGDVNII